MTCSGYDTRTRSTPYPLSATDCALLRYAEPITSLVLDRFPTHQVVRHRFAERDVDVLLIAPESRTSV